MYPAAFEYHAPTSVKDALKLLGKLDDAKLLAGGHSLVPMMKLRLAQPKHLIDLKKIPGLSYIKEDGGAIAIAAMTTPPAVRNRGTMGGSLANADPAADMPATIIAHGGEFVCEGPKGKSTV